MQPAAQVQVSQPYAGVTYVDRWIDAPRRIHLHLAQIDLTTPGLRFKVSPPGGDRETMRQSTLAFATQERAQLAQEKAAQGVVEVHTTAAAAG